MSELVWTRGRQLCVCMPRPLSQKIWTSFSRRHLLALPFLDIARTEWMCGFFFCANVCVSSCDLSPGIVSEGSHEAQIAGDCSPFLATLQEACLLPWHRRYSRRASGGQITAVGQHGIERSLVLSPSMPRRNWASKQLCSESLYLRSAFIFCQYAVLNDWVRRGGVCDGVW